RSCNRHLPCAMDTRRFDCCTDHSHGAVGICVSAHVERFVVFARVACGSCTPEILPSQRNFHGPPLAFGHHGNNLAPPHFGRIFALVSRCPAADLDSNGCFGRPFEPVCLSAWFHASNSVSCGTRIRHSLTLRRPQWICAITSQL